MRVEPCEAALAGAPLDRSRAAEVARLADSVSPLGTPFVSEGYRRDLVRVTVQRALYDALGSDTREAA